MTLVVLLSADGKMSPPLDIAGEEKDTVTMRLCLFEKRRFKEVCLVDFRKTDECVVHQDKLINVYKQVVES